MDKAEPNLFTYATSELSQDAILAWLLAWSDDAFTGELHNYGRRFLGSLFAKCGHTLPAKVTVEIKKQYGHIDVLAIVNDFYYVIIEDKIWTYDHDDQLARYVNNIIENECEKKIEILPIYLKFEGQSDYKSVEEAKYKIYKRCDFLSLFNDIQKDNAPAKQENAILVNFIKYVREADAEYEGYKTFPSSKWTSRTWRGFYTWVQSQFGDARWDYVPNPSGGFMGCWLGWSGFTPEMDLYVLLEEKKSCFKICTDDKEKRSELRDQARKLLHKVANEIAPQRVEKPGRLGCGTYMTIACLKPEVRVFDTTGKINLEQTKENIQLMLDIVAKTVELAQKEQTNIVN